MCRGDSRCVYKLRWSIHADGALVEAAEIAASRDRADSLVERFEQLHSMAAELANADHADTVLARVADRAGIAIHAPRYLLGRDACTSTTKDSTKTWSRASPDSCWRENSWSTRVV